MTSGTASLDKRLTQEPLSGQGLGEHKWKKEVWTDDTKLIKKTSFQQKSY